MEIENFDIDLLTMRTVNITGVLSLRGIGSADVQPAWQQEEYTVAYSPEAGDSRAAEEIIRNPENDTLYENSLWTYGEGTAEGSAEDQNSAAPAETALYAEDTSYSQPAAYLSTPLKDKEPRVRTHSLDTASSAGSKPAADKASAHFLTSREKTAPAAVNGSVQEDTTLQTGTAALNTVDHWGNAKLHAVSQPEPVLTSAANDAAALFAGNEGGEAAEEIQATDNEVFLSAESLSPQEEKQDLKVALGSKKNREPPSRSRSPSPRCSAQAAPTESRRSCSRAI